MRTQFRSQRELVLIKIADFFFSWQYKLGKFLDFSVLIALFESLLVCFRNKFKNVYKEQNLLRMSLRANYYCTSWCTLGDTAGEGWRYFRPSTPLWQRQWTLLEEVKNTGIRVSVDECFCNFSVKALPPKHMRPCSPGHLWSSSKQSYRWGNRQEEVPCSDLADHPEVLVMTNSTCLLTLGGLGSSLGLGSFILKRI